MPEYPGYGFEAKGKREELQALPRVAEKPAGAGVVVMEPMVVEEGSQLQDLPARSSRKQSRYYTGASWAGRLGTRFSQIGRAI